jgi:tripartite ATP-independent transporter DctP family solute receptor
MKNKKFTRAFIALLSLAIVMSIMTACQSNTAKPGGSDAIVLKLAHVNNEAYPYTDGSELFKSIIEEKTGGNIVVEIYPSGQLGNETDLIEQTKEGTIDFCITATAPISNFVSSFKVFDFPFIFRDSAHMFEVLDSEAGQTLMAETESIGITGLGFWDNGVRSPSNSIRPINSVADLKGLKIRVMENSIHIAAYNALGAIATPMAWGEVFTGLQQGTVDGFESSPVTYSTNKYYEVQDHWVKIDMIFSPGLLMANTDRLNSLSDEYQAIIKDAARQATLHEREVYIKKVEESLVDMTNNGMTITTPDKAEFVAAVETVYQQFGDEVGWDLINSIRG